jgi:hypothetical protein
MGQPGPVYAPRRVYIRSSSGGYYDRGYIAMRCTDGQPDVDCRIAGGIDPEQTISRCFSAADCGQTRSTETSLLAQRSLHGGAKASRFHLAFRSVDNFRLSKRIARPAAHGYLA